MKIIARFGCLLTSLCTLALLISCTATGQTSQRALDIHVQATVAPSSDKSMSNENWQESPTSSTPANGLKRAEDVPSYPNAQHITHDNTLKPWSPIVEYESTDSVQVVSAFYRTVLSKMGWKIIEDQTTEYGIGLEFVWTSKDLLSPYKLLLIISLGKHGGGTGDLTKEPTDAYTRITRWPYASRIPLYPGSQQIDEKDVPNAYGITERVTQYLTNAKPNEVETYYLSVLPNNGWGFVEPQRRGDKSFKGLVFNFDAGGPDNPKYSSLFLETTVERNGQTLVEMRTIGDDIPKHIP